MRRTKFLLCLLSFLLLQAGCTRPSLPEDTVPEEPVIMEETAPSGSTDEKFSRVVFAMDTVMDLTVYDDSDAVLDDAADRIAELETKLSVTLPESEISTLNAAGRASLTDETAELLETALALCECTDGALDITVYPIVRAWGFTTGEYRIPDEAELAGLLKTVNYAFLSLDGTNAAIPEGTQVDLGSVAKGYTGDILCDLFRENGITSALLNLGGNVQTVGSKPDGSPWRVAVQHPTNPEAYLGILSLSGQAAITSGGYERYFIGDDGEIYWHIIDPFTGKPADSGILSVTIVGESGVLCDAMSTALFVMGIDRAADYWRNHEGFDFIIVTEDGNVHITEGIRDRFTLSEMYTDKEMTVIER